MAASATSEKIFIFGAVILLMQVQGNVSADDDLEAIKSNAIEIISKFHNLFTNDYNEMSDYIRNAFTWIDKNEAMNNLIVKAVEEASKMIIELANELHESGMNQEKHQEYFDCLKKRSEDGIKQIKESMINYRNIMRSIQTEMLDDIEYNLYTINKLFEVIDGLKENLIQQINSFEDINSIFDLLRQTENAYDNAKFVLTSTWKKSVGIFLKFKTISYNKVMDEENIISNVVKNTQKELHEC